MPKHEIDINLLSNKEFNLKVGERIKELLNKQGIKQLDFANNYLFCDHTVLNRKLNGTKKFTTEELLKISKILDVDIKYIFLETNDPEYSKTISKKMAEAIDSAENQFYEEHEPLITFLKSLGYDIFVEGGSAKYNDKNEKVYASLHYNIYKNGKPVRRYSSEDWEIFKEKLNLNIQLIFLER